MTTNAPEAGCIFDGHGGQYIYGYIVDLATDHGYKPSDEYEAEVGRQFAESGTYGTPHLDDAEVVNHEAYLAEQYLNDHVVEPEHMFGWHDGEYFYMPLTWWDTNV